MPKTRFSVASLPHCRLSQSNCDIGDMVGATLVFTDDDNSKCLNGDPFAFVVKPGHTDKLMFYFPGGGACWQGSNSVANLCTDTLEDGSATMGTGITAENNNNNFRDYTFVAPAYCDGGAFISNATLGDKNKPQNGYLNTKYAVDWAKRNLNSRLTRFAIAGSSAGALGTMACCPISSTRRPQWSLIATWACSPQAHRDQRSGISELATCPSSLTSRPPVMLETATFRIFSTTPLNSIPTLPSD